MGRTVIKVRNLGKRYRIGLKEELHDSLIGGIASWAVSPFVNFRKLQRLSKFKSQDESDDIIWAVRDISFDLGEGEILGIIGHNGAGKSTLLKILSRIVEPTTGKAIVYGRVSSLLEVGTGFHRELTGRENIYLNGTILGMSKLEISTKLDEIIAFSEIEKFIDTPVKRYSSGMYVRLAFAVAAHLEPEILIVDEVLAVGDVQFRRKCLGKMSDVAKTGRTIIFVSHNMGAIHKLCTRAILIKNGMIEEDGKVAEVISKYVNPNLSEMQSSMMLPGAEENSPGRGLQLTFLGADNIENNHFNMGEIWKIQFEFEIFRKTPHVSAAVGPRNFDVSIKTFRTKPVDLEAGIYRAEFEFNIPVKSTELQFSVGLTTNETTFYYFHNAGHVSISEIYEGKHPVRTKDAGLLIDDEFEEIVHIQ
ncbi:MAG: ABC transporter ATP-binding protein [Candidatus Neomarinimicrobiota bacterium]